VKTVRLLDSSFVPISMPAASHVERRASSGRPTHGRHGPLRHERGVADDDVADGMAFGTQAAVVLANSRAYWQAFDLSRRDCSADEAFQSLVQASQRENVRLREIARRIVDNGAAET
jgi:hypothetical protein